MKHTSKHTITRIIALIFMLLAVLVAYFCFANWQAQYAYNSATNNLISNMKAANNIDTDKEILLTQQQQTDAQFNDALSQKMLLIPKLRNHIDHNAELSRRLTEKLRKNLGKNTKSSSTKNNHNKLKNNNANQHNKKQTEPAKPQLNNKQRNKVENLLKQNNHVDSQSSKNQQDQEDQENQEKTTKRTDTSDNNGSKPW